VAASQKHSRISPRENTRSSVLWKALRTERFPRVERITFMALFTIAVGFSCAESALSQVEQSQVEQAQIDQTQVDQSPPIAEAAAVSGNSARRVIYSPVKPLAATKELALIREIIEPEILMKIEPTKSKIIRTNYPIVRSAISDPEIVDIQAFGSNEFEVIGKGIGETSLTFWYELPNGQIDYLRYLVEVSDEGQKHKKNEKRY